MDIKRIRPGLGLVVCACALTLLAAASACDGVGKHPSASIGGAEARLAARRKLAFAPFTELNFVPADAEAVLRVDLAVLSQRDPETQRMLDFLLQAQQPTAWKFLGDAGVRAGRELRAVYLVVGPRAGSAPTASMLVAGVGDIDAARARQAFGQNGGVAEAAPGGATIFVWPHAQIALGMGSTIPYDRDKRPPSTAEELAQESAVGVASGLLLFGPPSLVRRALAVRAGEGKDVRVGALADEIASLATTASAWGVARQDSAGLVGQLAPGLVSGHFHVDLAKVGRGALELRAEFGADAEASAFAGQLETMIGAAALMTRKTPIGETLTRLRDAAPVKRAGKVVSIGAEL